MITVGYLRIFAASIPVMWMLAVLFWLLAGCATSPIGQKTADRTTQLWADVGTSGYLPPSVSVISSTEMQAMRGPGVIATYQCRERRMLIADGHTTDADWLAGILVHELVHHKQCLEGRLAGVRDMCPLEVEAYQAQIAWMRKQAAELGFFAGTNMSNYAAHVEKHLRKNFNRCL